MNEPPQLDRDQLTIEDVAHYLRRDACTIENWLHTGQLPGYALPDNHWLIMRDDLNHFLTTHRHTSRSRHASRCTRAAVGCPLTNCRASAPPPPTESLPGRREGLRSP